MEKILLDEIDKRLLAELDKNCRMPAAQLAKKVRRSREAVKYRIQQLTEKGIITQFITTINPNVFGYYMFKVYLQLENIQEEREKFYDCLKKRKDVYWFGISDGAFDCVIAFVSKSITAYYDGINELLSEYKRLIVRKVLGTMVDTRQFNKKFFTGEKDSSIATFAGDVKEADIDKIDMKILHLLANNARMHIAEISRRSDTTIEIVRGRMKKMEQNGAILGYRIDVDLNKLGYEFFKAIVYFKSLSEKNEKILIDWMRKHPNALYYIRSLAPWDAELEFAVESYQQFNKIMNDLRKTFPDVIRNYEHLIMIEEHWMPAWKA